MSIEDDINEYQQKSNINQDIQNYIAESSSPKTDVQNQIADAGFPKPTMENKVEPEFLKKLDMINTGVHRGVTNFTYALMSKLPFGKGYQEAIKKADADVEAEQQHNINTYSGYYPQVGEIGGEALATLPAGGLLGSVTKGAKALGEIAPTGLKTLAKYGSASGGGAGVLAGMESQRYDPENPGQLINKEAADAALYNPLSYVLPAAAAKISTWGQAAKDLGELKEVIPKGMARHLKEGPSKTVEDEIMSIVPNLFGLGKDINLMKGIGGDISKWISTVSGQPASFKSKDLIKYAGNQVQGALNVIKQKENLMWEKPFKLKPILNPAEVQQDAQAVIEMLKKSPIDRHSLTKGFLEDALKYKGQMTINDAKRIQSLIGNAMNATRKYGDDGRIMAERLGQYKENVLNNIQKSLGPEDLKDFTSAKTFSSMKHQMEDGSIKIRNALKDQVNARKLIKDLISEKEVTDKDYLNILPERGRKATSGAKLAQIMEASDAEGKFNLGSFLTKTKEATEVPEILGSSAYKSLEGFNKYLSAINDSSKVGVWKQLAMLGAAGAATGGGGLAAGGLGAAVPLVTYGLAHFAANHSPLKSILHALPKKLSEPTYNYLIDKVGKHLTRAGYFMSDDGVFKHKEEDKDE